MAGHSKFKNIMHRKGRADAARSRLFSKLSREITVAAKHGLPDPAMNPRLRLAVQNAKAESMSKDVIERAIKKASGGDAETDEEIRYEGFGPGYTAFESLNEVAQALEAALGPAKSTAIAWRPKSQTPVEGEAVATLMKLLEALEDDDVQNVWSNEDISAEELEKLAS